MPDNPPDPLADALEAQGADAVGHVPGALRHPPWLLIATGAVAAATLLLGAIGDLIEDGGQFAFDSALLLAARGGHPHGAPAGPQWLQLAVLDVTALGGPTVLIAVIVIASGFFALQRLWLTLALVLGGTITGSIVVGIAKQTVGRARPTLTDHLTLVWSPSFPSGHAANSAIVYLTLAILVMQITPGRFVRGYILGVTALLVTAIGISRVYLGVHWPSDVIVGWSFGTLWAIGWWAIGAWIRLKRAGQPVLQPGE